MNKIVLKLKKSKFLQNSKFLISKILIWLIFFASLYFVHKTINNYDNIEIILSITNNLLSKNNIAYFILLTFLLVINWSLEGLKWQLLIEKIEKISFLKSLESIVSGITLNIISFIGFAGVIAGRVWHLKSAKRIEVIAAISVNSLFQSLVTILWGCFGLVYFLNHKNILLLNEAIIILLFVAIIHVISLWLLCKKLKSIYVLKPFTKHFYKYLKLIEQYNSKTLLRIYLFSFMRYIVFLTQFIIVLYVFNVKLELIVLISGISLIFLSKYFAFNTNVFLDLGVRELSAIFFLGYFGIDKLTVICATFAIWFLNIIIPSIFGLGFIFRMKVLLKDND